MRPSSGNATCFFHVSTQVTDPNGYRFIIAEGPGNVISKVAIQVTSLDSSIGNLLFCQEYVSDYWKNVLGMALLQKNNDKKQALLSFGPNQVCFSLPE